jgi:hypothetical protein
MLKTSLPHRIPVVGIGAIYRVAENEQETYVRNVVPKTWGRSLSKLQIGCRRFSAELTRLTVVEIPPVDLRILLLIMLRKIIHLFRPTHANIWVAT